MISEENSISTTIIDMDKKSIKSYLGELRKKDVVKGDEQIELVRRAQKGDSIAFNKLIEGNLRFVVSVAKEYVYSGIPLEDLISEGNVGLMEAVDKFDPDRGFRFISYAVWWIRQAIKKHINDNGSNVRLPVNKINAFHKISNTKKKLEQVLERPANDNEIYKALNGEVSLRDIKSIDIDSNFEQYVDEKIPSSEDLTLIDVLEGNDFHDMEYTMRHKELSEALKTIMNKLSKKEAQIIQMYYGIPTGAALNLREIGQEIGLTDERIRQIMAGAFKKMRVFENMEYLDEFRKDF